MVVLLVVVILSFQVHAQNSSAGIITHKNPSVEAMRLRGDVSCMKIYRTPWNTQFGERVDEIRSLEQILYFDSEHRLLSLEEWELKEAKNGGMDGFMLTNFYVYEYEYNSNGNLTTVNCYRSSTFPNLEIGDLEWKMKLIPENGVIVGHKYDGIRGDEEARLEPYNIVSGILTRGFHIENDEYVFAFDMKAIDSRRMFADEKYKSTVRADYYYQYNKNNQLTKLHYPLGSFGGYFIDAYFSYDNKGNLTSVDFHTTTGPNASGEKWTLEYTYGDFEESAKHSYKSYLEYMQKKEELKRIKQDSIKVAEEKEKIRKEMEKAEMQKAREKSKIKEGIEIQMRRSSTNSLKDALKIGVKMPQVHVNIEDLKKDPIKSCYKYSDDSGNYIFYLTGSLKLYIASKNSRYYVIDLEDWGTWGYNFDRQVYSVYESDTKALSDYLSTITPTGSL